MTRILLILLALQILFFLWLFNSGCSLGKCHDIEHSCPEKGHGPCFLEKCCNGH